MRTLDLFLIVMFSLLLYGCSESGPELYDVSGTVSMDGVPVQEGEIVFRAIDPPGRNYAGRIDAGRFLFQTTPGKKRVEITGFKENPNQGPPAESGEQVPTMIMHIPPQYNINSTLEKEVQADGQRVYEFKLTTQVKGG